MEDQKTSSVSTNTPTKNSQKPFNQITNKTQMNRKSHCYVVSALRPDFHTTLEANNNKDFFRFFRIGKLSK